VSGLGIGKGYWKEPGKTAQSFIRNPYTFGIADQDYAVLYKTGDIGYFRDDGNIEYLGRIDNQVKIRGFRIEPEEIEAVMLKYQSLTDCAVVVKKKEGKADSNSLVGFIVEKEKIDIEAFKKFLLEYLPHHMIPPAFVKLDELPLNISGKVDKQVLVEMNIDALSLDSKKEFTGPISKTEKLIAKIWSEALEIDTIGIHDNFFDLGGHSLLIPRIHRKLRKSFPGKCEIADLFEYTTIYELSRHIEGIVEDEEDEIIELDIE
jgi:hypothetical protein